MSEKKIESLDSKKFDLSKLMNFVGGASRPIPTYGNVYNTRYDGMGGQEGDFARTTTNPENYPVGTVGTDYIKP